MASRIPEGAAHGLAQSRPGPSARVFERIWYGRRGLTSQLLRPLSWIFAVIVSVRRWLYRRRWFPCGHPGVPVIIVGNITVGGTGKTPLVQWLARRLQERGRQVAVVSRGFGGRRHSTPRQVPAGGDASIFGDEPVLLANGLDCPVWVCIDRLEAARAARAAGADVIVADDGLQHYRLQRDLEIVVVDDQRDLGNGLMLPAGPLREPARRLDEASLVLRNRHEVSGPANGFTLVPGLLQPLNGGPAEPLDALRGQAVLALAGIGNPQRFYNQLQRFEIQPRPVPVPDHGRADLDALAAEGLPLVMTEKDYIKYNELDEIPNNFYYLPVAVVCGPETQALVDSLLNRLPDTHKRHAL